MSQVDSQNPSFNEQLDALFAHLEHVLPNQAPLQDFVHHNTLHGLQTLSFEEAVKKAYDTTGNYGYLPLEKFREYYQQGRITATDLQTVLNAQTDLAADTPIFSDQNTRVSCVDVYQACLLYPLKSISACQLNWQIEENKALSRIQADVSPRSREQLLNASNTSKEEQVIGDLWSACLDKLGLAHRLIHPEELQNLSEQSLSKLFNQSSVDYDFETVNKQVNGQATQQLKGLLMQIGEKFTLSEFVQKLTGEDSLSEMNPLFIRYAAGWLDQGVSAWQPPQAEQGFYQAWKASAQTDFIHLLEDMPDWHDHLESLPDDASETIAAILTRTGIRPDAWMAYLEKLALSLPGWSGMFLWRHEHPHYKQLPRVVDMRDYLAVRLVMEHLFVQRICRHHWLISASLFDLNGYFSRHGNEFMGRYHLFNQHLPEYLISRLQGLLVRSTPLNPHQEEWQRVTYMIWVWQQSPSSDQPQGYSVYRSAWPLFRLVQHLGCSAEQIMQLDEQQISLIFECLAKLSDRHSKSFLWLQAYEIHYRDQILSAVVSHHRHLESMKNNQKMATNWASRDQRPRAQLIFCMDDREESIRRHIEELHPEIETLGAAAFFNVIMNWQGLDDSGFTASCPVVAVPEHSIKEVPQPDQLANYQKHQHHSSWRLRIHNRFHQEIRRNPLLSALLMVFSLPLTLTIVLGRAFSPLSFGKLTQQQIDKLDVPVKTELEFTAKSAIDHSPSHNQLGFTDQEQADRVFGFLNTIGLNKGLAPLILVMGHGSHSLNNTHLAAYDCGACSGRHSGPNARVFAAMANRPEIRRLLAKKGLSIADDCWFIGAEHNTANEQISCYDTDKIPAPLQAAFNTLQTQLDHATLYSAQERCRKFASAPNDPELKQAYKHVVQRSVDIAQNRPELGHSTNAVAFIGRRSVTRGIFFDRRAFLISYDYRGDNNGEILERILLSAGPVGAGINLEYYFSTVNNEAYGCGPKTVHNLTGLFGVMEGASSDLRTGLPWQMLDIHEAMRLQVIVEATVETLTAIYQRQPPLQELVGKGWILLIAKDPESEALFIFDPAQGFNRWQGDINDLPEVKRSGDWYRGHRAHLPPALVTQSLGG